MRIISAAEDPRDGYPCVFVDDRDAAYAITEHLIQLGHQRIGFLWGGKAHRSSPERFKGYEQALKHYGIAIDKSLIVEGDYSFDDGFRGARKLFALKHPPTAIFGSNDEIAAGVLAAAKSANMNVPYDLSIAGFEDSPFSRQCWPALTTAKQATEEIARRATVAPDRRAETRRTSRAQHAKRRLQSDTRDPRIDRAGTPGRMMELSARVRKSPDRSPVRIGRPLWTLTATNAESLAETRRARCF